MTTSPVAEWIQRIDDALVQLDERPPFGGPAPFPQKELEKHLLKLFNLSELQLALTSRGWVKNPLESNSEGKIFYVIQFAPLAQPLYFLTSRQDLKFLMSELLGGDKASAPFYEKEEMEGFAEYLGLEVLSVLDETQFGGDLLPRLGEIKTEVEECAHAFVIDVSARLKQGSFFGKVLLPEPFRKAWKGHFASTPPPKLNLEERKKIPVEVAFEAGQGWFSLQEWKSVREGDFVVLDHISLDPSRGKGSLILTIEGRPIFRGKWREEGIKLLEYPIYEEVRQMTEEKFNHSEDLDLYGDEDEIVAEENGEAPREFAASEVKEAISPNQIPLLLTVEVGRLKMSVEELMQLAPGSLIDLKMPPEQGVDLVVGGKKVGRGELIKIGEALGVRVLKL